jgi:hypothetical protein
MFNAAYFRRLMHAQPFKPFRVKLTNGDSYEVANHDSGFVLSQCLEVGIDPDEQGFAKWTARCAYLHIASIEELQAA